MARNRRENRKSRGGIQFKLGWGGLFTLGIATVCALLWMFVLGVWVGKRLPARSASGPVSQARLPQAVVSGKTVAAPVVAETKNRAPDSAKSTAFLEPQAGAPSRRPPQEAGPGVRADGTAGTPEVKKTTSASVPAGEPKKASAVEQAYFVLQVGSYRSKAGAEKEAAGWRDKGYRVRVQRVELGREKGVWHRVYVGRFKSVEEAKETARTLARTESVKAYVVSVKD